MRLVFATKNKGKFQEAQLILPSTYTLVSLDDIKDAQLPEETEPTLEGNALLKARYIHQRFKMPCFADDTGLFIKALDGAPGVHSARFAGTDATDEKNVEKVLKLLKGIETREAYFKTVIALIVSGKEFVFEGTLDGVITLDKMGSEGFGYDPIFVPRGFSKTLAAMSPKEKNALSHRRRALVQMTQFME